MIQNSNKNVGIKFSAHDTFGMIFIKYAQSQNIWKPNNLKVFVCKKTKGPKQDSQHRLKSFMPEGGEL
jgi:hypothetical protein